MTYLINLNHLHTCYKKTFNWCQEQHMVYNERTYVLILTWQFTKSFLLIAKTHIYILNEFPNIKRKLWRRLQTLLCSLTMFLAQVRIPKNQLYHLLSKKIMNKFASWNRAHVFKTVVLENCNDKHAFLCMFLTLSFMDLQLSGSTSGFNIKTGELFAFFATKVHYYHNHCVCVFSSICLTRNIILWFANFKARLALKELTLALEDCFSDYFRQERRFKIRIADSWRHLAKIAMN